jgi:Mitochondrial carrier protein
VKNDTSSTLYYSSSASSSSSSHRSSDSLSVSDNKVRWEDLLTSVHPLTCDVDDEECFLRQQQPQQQQLLPISHHRVTGVDIAVSTAFLLASAAALLGLVRASGPGAWRYYWAGGICAATSHVIPVPIDVVKTRKQVDPALATENFWQAFSYIFKTEGVAGLLSGLGPTAIGYLLEGKLFCDG